MGLYKLVIRDSNDLSSGYLQKALSESIDYEKDFENWLENSPNLLLEEEGETIIWIGRQVKISTEDTGKYLDLLGIDSSGDVVIVELKKGRTPREVIAQNHASRKHYPGGQQDLYYKVDKGIFRLYNPEKDGKWDAEGKRID